MAEAAVGAGVASVAALGLSAGSSIMKGQGEQAAANFKADRAERAADFGKLQASLTDVDYREKLNTTLDNIEVIRAAAHIDPTSPTTAAVEDRQKTLSERQRSAAAVTSQAQIAEDYAGANFLRQSGDYALDMAYVDAAAKVAGGVGKMKFG